MSSPVIYASMRANAMGGRRVDGSDDVNPSLLEVWIDGQMSKLYWVEIDVEKGIGWQLTDPVTINPETNEPMLVRVSGMNFELREMKDE